MTHTPSHTPDTHVWFTQATGAPHIPVVSHVSTPLPEHWIAPGTQVPLHAPLVQMPMHGEGVPQVPVGEHVCTPSPRHCVAPATHVPVQAPDTQVWPTHGTGVPQVPGVPVLPAAPHVSTPLLEHWSAPGEHSTQAPSQHVGVVPEHIDCDIHWPVASQDWTTLPTHCTCPGPHTPVQVPETQVWLALQSLCDMHPGWQVLLELQ